MCVSMGGDDNLPSGEPTARLKDENTNFYKKDFRSIEERKITQWLHKNKSNSKKNLSKSLFFYSRFILVTNLFR